MEPLKKDIIYTSFPKSSLLYSHKFYTGILTDITRANMGGSEGIHKPTSGNPNRLRR